MADPVLHGHPMIASRGMRIVVNDIAAGGGGALTVLESFYRHVRDCEQDDDWVFLLGRNQQLAESKNIRIVALPAVKRSWLKRLMFDRISGRRLIASLNPDVIFSLQNTYTYGLKCPQVIYVHQPLPFQRVRNFSFWRRKERLFAIYQYLIGAIIKQSIRRADHVIVQTRWMRDAILDQVGIPTSQIECVLPDLEDLSAYKSSSPFEPRTFFYPTTDHIYKNNGCVYEACDVLRAQGVTNFSVTITTADASLGPNVAQTGPLPRPKALEIMSRSTLIYPSLIESYGLPLAEARALDTIVLAADCPYAREVLHGYENAYYFDPSSPSELAALMHRVIRGVIVRSSAERNAVDSCRGTPLAGWARVIEILEGYGHG